MPIIIFTIIGACLSIPFIVYAGESASGRTIVPRTGFIRRFSSEKRSVKVPATPSPTVSLTEARTGTPSPIGDTDAGVFEPRPPRRVMTIEEDEIRLLSRERRIRTGWSVETAESHIRGVGGLETTGFD